MEYMRSPPSLHVSDDARSCSKYCPLLLSLPILLSRSPPKKILIGCSKYVSTTSSPLSTVRPLLFITPPCPPHSSLLIAHTKKNTHRLFSIVHHLPLSPLPQTHIYACFPSPFFSHRSPPKILIGCSKYCPPPPLLSTVADPHYLYTLLSLPFSPS